jgi:hypothetical protein
MRPCGRRCDRASGRRVLAQGEMCARAHVVGGVLSQNPMKPRRIYHEYVTVGRKPTRRSSGDDGRFAPHSSNQ